jgi:hypothetical protein
MNRLYRSGAVALVLTLLWPAAPAGADVRTEQKSLVRFEGMIGRMVGLFGGRAAREGVVTTTILHGDRKMTRTDQSAQIVDLAEEKVYDLDLRRRTYRVTTFDELRRQMEEARRRAEEEAGRAAAEPAEEPDQAREDQREFEIDFDIRESGERRSINTFDTREVVMTVTVREKGKTLEESGGIVLTANSWLGPQHPGLRELADFERRYFEKLHADVSLADAQQQMAMALALFPGLGQAMERYQQEQINLEGTPILTTVTLEAVRTAEPAAAQREQRDEPAATGVGGLVGGLGRRIGRRGADREEKPAEPEGPERSTILTINTEVMSVARGVSAQEVQIPDGFKER